MDETTLRELLDVLLRWVHLIAGIMWIGNSLLFNWLDRNLVRDADGDARHVGRIWLLHSGGFYDVEKKYLAPSEMPAALHWFKWQSYTTWLTGLSLLVLLYWTGGASLMIDPSIARLSPGQALATGVGVVFGGFLAYDLVWRVLGKLEAVATAVSIAGLAGIVWWVTHVLSGRAAFIHVGALLGTVMAGNVLHTIIPSQRKLVAATKAGKPQDPAIGAQAKQRSIHNNYVTFPLLFTMLSNHFAAITGSRLNWLLLALFFVGGAVVRHLLNVRFTFGPWVPAVTGTVLATFAAVAVVLARTAPPALASDTAGPPVELAQVQAIVQTRCTPCHSDAPSLASTPPAPAGIRFGTPEELDMWRQRIRARVVVSRTMPLNNRTEITEEERGILARWTAQGPRAR